MRSSLANSLVATSFATVLLLSGCGGSSPSGAGSDTTAATAAAAPAPGSDTTAAAPVGSIADTGDGMAQLAAALGITEQKDLDCIMSKVDPTATTVAGQSAMANPEVLKAVFSCQPPGLVAVISQQIAGRIPSASAAQTECAGKATLKVLAAQDDLDFSALSGNPNDVPMNLQNELLSEMEQCGFSELDLRTAAGLQP